MKIDKNVFWAVIIPVIIAVGILLHFYTNVGAVLDVGTGTAVVKKKKAVKKTEDGSAEEEELDEIYIKFIEVMEALRPYVDVEITDKDIQKAIDADIAAQIITKEGFENGEITDENILLQLNNAYAREFEVMTRINELEIGIPVRLEEALDCSGNNNPCDRWAQSIDIDELYNIEVSAGISEADELKALRLEQLDLFDKIFDLELKSIDIYYPEYNGDVDAVKHITYHDVLEEQVTEIENKVKAMPPPPDFDLGDLENINSFEDIQRLVDMVNENINYYTAHFKDDPAMQEVFDYLNETLVMLEYMYIAAKVNEWLLEEYDRPIYVEIGMVLFYTPIFNGMTHERSSLPEIKDLLSSLLDSFINDPLDVFIGKINELLK